VSHALDALFRPASVAIIGASSDPTRIGGRPVAFSKRAFRGAIVPINPKGGEIQGLPAYASIAAATTFPGVAAAIDHIADVQVRNRGTIGGSIAHADPGADFPAIALAFEGSAVLRGPGGERVVPLDGFFEGPFQTAIRPDEILVAVRRGPVPDGANFAYMKLPQPASGYAIVGVAAVIGTSNGTISHAAIGVTGLHEHPFRAEDVEKALIGSDGSDAAIEAAAAHVDDDVEPSSDIHADGERSVLRTA